MAWVLLILALPVFLWGAMTGNWKSPQIRLGVVMLVVAGALFLMRL